METLKKAIKKRILRKAKYTKRTGSPGSYKYQYGEGRGHLNQKQESTLARIKQTGQHETYKVTKTTPSHIIVEFGNSDRYRIENDGRSKQTAVSGEREAKTAKRPETKAERKLLTRKKAAYRGEPSGLTAKVEQLRSELKKYKKDPKGLPSSILGNLKQLMERDKATQDYHWLAGFTGSEEKGKAIYGEMIKRGIVEKEKGLIKPTISHKPKAKIRRTK